MKIQKVKRQKRTREKLRSVGDRLRLRVFRSNKYIYAQIIDDTKRNTLIGVSEKQTSDASAKKVSKIERARLVGRLLAEIAKEKNIREIAFDKGSYAYHGRVKALAEGAREGGLQF